MLTETDRETAALPGSVRLGRLLFRARSFTPVLPLTGLSLLFAVRSRLIQVPSAALQDACVRIADAALSSTTSPGAATLVAPLSILVGLALRARVVAHAPHGTSGRGRHLAASRLVTWGAYSRVRNPLYLANTLIWLGTCAFVLTPSALAVLGCLFAVQQRFIVRAEEHWLEAKFGLEYRQWAAVTPRWIPSLGSRPVRLAAADPAGPGWRQALRSEADTWFAGLSAIAGGVGLHLGPSPLVLSLWGLTSLAWLGVKIPRRIQRLRRT